MSIAGTIHFIVVLLTACVLQINDDDDVDDEKARYLLFDSETHVKPIYCVEGLRLNFRQRMNTLIILCGELFMYSDQISAGASAVTKPDPRRSS